MLTPVNEIRPISEKSVLLILQRLKLLAIARHLKRI